MAHDHHHHGSARDYFVEQLLTIFVVGAFGVVGVLLYTDGRLQYILAPAFHLPVLIGGIAVLAVVAVRAVAVWQEAGAAGHQHHLEHGHHHHEHDHAAQHGHPVHHHHDHHEHHEHGPDCDHDHDHGPDCDHDHAHHDHGHDHSHDDHGHSHDLSWVIARMLVLFFPVALYLIGVPNSGFSQERILKMLSKEEALGGDVGAVATGDGHVMSFNDLNEAAYDESKREALSGKVGILVGRFDRIADKEFRLYRLKMTCCAADTVPLKVRILTKTAVSGFQQSEWVQVKGEVRFIQPPGSTQYIPVIAVADVADIQRTKGLSEYE